MEDEQETIVVFRKDPVKEGNNVFALFPEIPTDLNGRYCQSFGHVGQHSSADYHYCILQSSPASPEEYADLKEELERIGYKLRVVERSTPAMHRARFDKAAEWRALQ